MYLSDWDNNGDIDPILAIQKNGCYYPFFGKTDLEKRLPGIKKKYLYYASIAGKTTEEIFGKDKMEKSKKLEAYTLKSSVMINNQGKFSLKALPDFLQTAPVFAFTSFTKNARTKFIAGGNFYEVSPYEGRYDALLPTVFDMYQNKIRFEHCIAQKGCIRDIKTMVIGKEKNVLLMAKNNEGLGIILIDQ